MKILDLSLIMVFILGIFALGWFSSEIYRGWNNEKTLNGLWLNNYNYTEAKAKASEMDNSGQWVCVNVDKDMSFDEVIETCQHEAGHELFARKCSANPEVCFKLMKELEENETK